MVQQADGEESRGMEGQRMMKGKYLMEVLQMMEG